jgi:predicted RNA binding protein YcfA (HicA-like mRNA interferase family)
MMKRLLPAVLTNSRDVKRRLEADGRVLVRTAGSHHIFRHPATKVRIVLPHPKRDLGAGLIR